MLYDGVYSCGHAGEINVCGPHRDRQWKVDRKFSGLCPECYKKKIEEEKERKNREAAEKSAEMELPELTGTEKQVAWATTLRMEFIKKYEKKIAEGKENLEKILKSGGTIIEELMDA